MISIDMVEILKLTFRMQLNYKLFVLFLLTLSSNLFSQDVQLKIIASSYEGKTAYIWIEDDFFTGHKLLFEEKSIDNEEVSFTFKTDKILRIRIGIDYQYATMYIEPHAKYTVAFPKHDPDNNRSLAWNTRVMLSYIDLQDNDINAQIMQLNGELDDFFANLLMVENTNEPTYDPTIDDERPIVNPKEAPANFSQRESLEQFNLYIRERDEQDTLSSTFFSSYKEYSNASIAFSLGEKRDKLYARYIEGKAIDYNNPEYALFFNDFYSNYFNSYTYYPLSEKLEAAFKSNDVRASLEHLITADKQTGDKQLQELLLMKSLYEFKAGHPEIDSILIETLNEIAKTSQYPENKEIAINYLQKTTKGQVGKPFPAIEFISYTGDTVTLISMEGKLTYIQLFATWNASSLAELELMNELYKKYNNQVQFISLSIDPDLESFNEFVKKHREYRWELAWIGVHPQTLEDLSIYTVPLFYLIDDELKIMEWPALWPSTGIEKTFFEADLKKKEEKKNRFWENQTNKSIKEE